MTKSLCVVFTLEWKKVVIVIALILSTQSSYSQTLSDTQKISEEDFTSDIPIVISASRIPQRKTEAPASITVIDRETIDALGVINIVDILRLVPGFQVAHVTGNTFAATYHGLSYDYPRKLQVMIDGRSVYRPLLSNVDWSNLGIAVSDIERIEVIRGPNTPAYGTNAFLGTVNIITREPYQDPGVRIEATAGANNLQRYNLKYAGNYKQLEYRITAGYRKSYGFDNVDDSREITSGAVRAIYNINALTDLQMQFGYSGGTMGANGNDTLLNPIRDTEVTSNYSFLRWNKTLSSTENIYIQIYQNFYKQEDNFYIGPLSAVSPEFPNEFVELGVFDGVGERLDFEIQHNIKFTNSLRLVWGGGVRQDRISGEKIIDIKGDVKDNSSRIFSSIEWRVTVNTIINAGAMYENNEIIGEAISPRIAFNYKINHRHTLRLSATQAFRSPSLYEANNKITARLNDGTLLRVNFDHDRNIDPEELLSYELGYIGSLPELNLSFDVKLFKEDLTNFISAPVDANYPQPPLPVNIDGNQAKIWKNGGDVSSDGFETQIVYTPSSKTSLLLNYAYARASGMLLEQINPDRRDDLSNNIPSHTVSMLWQQRMKRNWKGSVAFYQISEMEWGGGGDLVNAYHRWDLHVSKTRIFGGSKGEIGITIQNLTGEKYHEFRIENEFRRRAYLQLKFLM